MNLVERYPIKMDFRLDADLRDQLQENANNMGISISALIRMILKQTMDNLS
jgi:antitoxin component of RelBE/YafQ-DinJ toxin-antitoxin module